MAHLKNGFAPAGIIALIAAGAIVILGGATVGVMKLSQTTEPTAPCEGGTCPSATSTAAFPEPDWTPKTQCGDNVCNPNEKANPAACPQDCAVAKEVPKPAIESFKATPSSVISGKPVTLSWSSTSSFCASSGAESSWFATGGASSGSVETRPLSATRTFILSCMAEDGATITKSVTVPVTPPAKPIVTPQKIPAITYFAAEPASVVTGKTTTLSWATKDVSSCTASGGDPSWAGKRTSDGSYTTSEITRKQVYTLTCTGNNRTTTQKITVNVTAVPSGPSITFSVIPAAVTAGAKATIAWMSSSAASCTAGGSGANWGWTGSVGMSGTQTTPALKDSQMYSITCVGKDGGTTTKSASVSVTAPKATLSLLPATQTIGYGKTASLRWTSSGVTSCTGSGSWADSDSFSLNDTKFTQALTESTIFEITCTGEGGSVTQKATVNVGEAPNCTNPSAANGDSATRWSQSSIPWASGLSSGGSCSDSYKKTQTCSEGKWKEDWGAYTHTGCTVGTKPTCTYPQTGTYPDCGTCAADQKGTYPNCTNKSYYWSPSDDTGWSPATVSCPTTPGSSATTKTQTRTVTCKDGDTGASVGEPKCTGTKPLSTKTTNCPAVAKNCSNALKDRNNTTVSLNNGDSRAAYSTNLNDVFGRSCNSYSATVSCNNGTISPSAYQYVYCDEKWAAHGETIFDNLTLGDCYPGYPCATQSSCTGYSCNPGGVSTNNAKAVCARKMTKTTDSTASGIGTTNPTITGYEISTYGWPDCGDPFTSITGQGEAVCTRWTTSTTVENKKRPWVPRLKSVKCVW